MNAFPFAWIAYGWAMVVTLAVVYAVVRPFRDPLSRSARSSLGSLRADLDELAEILKRLDARDRMRSVRAARAESAASSSPTTSKRANGSRPDPHTDPVGWKAYMRAQHPAIGPHNPPKGDE